MQQKLLQILQSIAHAYIYAIIKRDYISVSFDFRFYLIRRQKSDGVTMRANSKPAGNNVGHVGPVSS